MGRPRRRTRGTPGRRIARFGAGIVVMCAMGAATRCAAGCASADYRIETDCQASGGRSVSGPYRAETSVGEIGGQGACGPGLVRQGYVGQLYDIVGLALKASPTVLNEGETRQVTAVDQLDDGTVLGGAPCGATWSTGGWPLQGVTPSGVVSAALVYADATGCVWAARQSLTGALDLVVLNVNPDDFDTYGGDGLPDDWQVLYFGVGHTNACPGCDADGDGRDNEHEQVTGTDPTNEASCFALWVEAPPPPPSNCVDLVFGPCCSGRTYTVSFRTNLVAGAWTHLVGGIVADNGDERTVTDTNALSRITFYRVNISLP